MRCQVEPVGVLAGAAGARLARRERGGGRSPPSEVEGRRGDLERDEGVPLPRGGREGEEARGGASHGGDGPRDLPRQVPLRPVVEGPGPPGGLGGVGGEARVRGLEEGGGGSVVL